MYSSFLDCRAVRSQNQFLRGSCELDETGNGKIFVVEIGVIAQDVVGLSAVLSVSARPRNEMAAFCNSTYLLDNG
jgi:hypothetical protein